MGYLGYALAQYSEFYKIDHVMILGRVSKGAGGDIMLDTAKKVLQTEFPQYEGIQFHTADDHFKGVGQCIAAAALPSSSTSGWGVCWHPSATCVGCLRARAWHPERHTRPLPRDALPNLQHLSGPRWSDWQIDPRHSTAAVSGTCSCLDET